MPGRNRHHQHGKSPLGAEVSAGAAEVHRGMGHDALPPASNKATPEKQKKESTSNIMYWFVTYPKRTLLPGLRIPVLVNIVWSWVLAYAYGRGLFTALDASPHTYVGGPLGFLLAFRCSSSLSRCDKGREVSATASDHRQAEYIYYRVLSLSLSLCEVRTATVSDLVERYGRCEIIAIPAWGNMCGLICLLYRCLIYLFL